MSDVPLPGPGDVTLSQIEDVLSSCLRDPKLPIGNKLPQVKLETFQMEWSESRILHYNKKQRVAKLEGLCRELFLKAKSPATHVQEIDSLLASFMKCQFSFEDRFENVSRRAHHLLERLPLQPLALIDFPKDLNRGYFRIDHRLKRPELPTHEPTWENLLICNTLSINVARAALLVESDTRIVHIVPIWDYNDLLAEILETSCHLSSSACQEDSAAWFIVRAAVWSSWQRCQMLYFWGLARNHFSSRDKFWLGSQMRLLTPTPSPGLSLEEMSRRYASEGKEDYMCSWAFELLRAQKPCIGMDFRRLHATFRDQWQGHAGRCKGDSRKACEVTEPSACQRSTGLKIIDQSAHDSNCSSSCHRLIWDRTSFLSIQGSRAVSLVNSDTNGLIRYCAASERTLAISHVWSHGQGGRPRSGINRCLHLRYRDVARQLNCDSYWWDAPCIPEEHKLRQEAIRNINQTFAASKVTLVCDRDLMAIDASDLGMRMKQSIFATFLVCDWNVRAWTYLESMCGRNRLYILCKNNVTVPFQEIIEDIVRNGPVDLALLCITIPHALLSWEDWTMSMISANKTGNHTVPGITPLEIEAAGSFLSHRPASRAGDDMVIWSLLTGGKPSAKAKEFWRNLKYVNAEFLLSSAPRLTLPGLSWAPASPYCKPDHRLATEGSALLSYRGSESSQSGLARITGEGLVGAWMMYEFRVPGVSPDHTGRTTFEDCTEPECVSALLRISGHYLSRCSRGALLQPAYNTGRIDTNKYRGTMVAVLGAREKGFILRDKRRWKWKGVLEWEKNVPLPPFKYVPDLLIA